MCFGSRDKGDHGTARSRELDRQIRQDEKRMSKEVKLLLLGAGESGKSTVLKQMKLIYSAGFSKNEKLEWKPVVFNNIVQSFKVIFEAMEELHIPFENPDNEKHMAHILVDHEISPQERMPEDYLEPVKSLWADSGVRTAISKGNEYALHDNLSYFIDDIDRLWAEDFVPNDQDLLRSRLRTTGITETIFDLGQLTYRMFDVGGQRSERKKWIHCFENVTALVFLVALSEYDQMLYEDESVNRMQEALTLFDSICNSRWFVKTSIILFLNKIDLFQEKLVHSPLSDYFPDFTGGDNYDAACDYLLHRFVSLNQSAASKQIYAHYTCATDTQQIKFVLSAIQDILLQLHLRECGLL